MKKARNSPFIYGKSVDPDLSPKEIKGAATVEGARVPPRWRETSKIKVQIGGQSPKCQSGWKGELGQVRERELDE